jgi:drug efflux transport system permease protein/drug efflux transport system ATP-binding protein
MAVIYKELRQARRDPATMFLAMLIPVIQLTIFGYAIDTEIRNIPTVVVDRARIRESREFVSTLEATGTFRVRHRVESRDEALSLLRGGEAHVAVVFPEDLGERLLAGETTPVQVLIDGSDSNLALHAQTAALGTAAAISARNGAVQQSPSFEARTRLLYNPDGESSRFFVPGLAGIILQLVTMVLTAFAIVRERERGTLEQLLVTPISALSLTLGKILPAAIMGAIASVLVIGAMVLVFQVPIAGSLGLLAVLLLLFVLTSLALGLLISSIARNQLQALMFTMLVLLPSVLLSGFVFPRESMPVGIYEATWLIPATYFVEIMRGLILRGANAAELAHSILPLAALGGVLLLAATLRLRRLVG